MTGPNLIENRLDGRSSSPDSFSKCQHRVLDSSPRDETRTTHIMKKITPALVIASILALRIAAFAGGEKKATEKQVTEKSAAAQTAEHGLFPPGDIKWPDAPPALPPRAKLALLERDPPKQALYTLRLQLPY